MRIGYGSALFDDLYVSQEMAEVFSATSQVKSWLDVEAALARAQSRLGLVPEEAAAEITRNAVPTTVDIGAYTERLAATAHPIMPLVGLLAAACGGDAGQYVHWGATTQDIMDTGLVLQLAQAADLVERDAGLLQRRLEELAVKHRSTVMPGRTHGQHAVPITFGYKVAVWVDELRRLRRAFSAAADDAAVVQFAGAAGTLASLGPVGLEVRSQLADELSLATASIAWHTSRDRLVTLAFHMTGLAGLCRKIAGEVATLQRTEMGELEEPFHMGKIGSSTMPHKRNPMFSEIVWSIGALVVDTFGSIQQAALQQHERDMGAWQIEWDAIPRLFVLAHRAITLMRQVAGGLVVKEDRMLANLDLTGGLINSEAVMMALATHIGRQRAHEVVYGLAMRSVEEGVSFAELLSSAPDLQEPETARDVMEALDPRGVIAAAELQVDAIVEMA